MTSPRPFKSDTKLPSRRWDPQYSHLAGRLRVTQDYRREARRIEMDAYEHFVSRLRVTSNYLSAARAL